MKKKTLFSVFYFTLIPLILWGLPKKSNSKADFYCETSELHSSIDSIQIPIIISSTANPSSTFAILSGSVNPNGLNTIVWYETPAGEHLGEMKLGNGNVKVDLCQYLLLGLNPLTPYKFKVVVSNNKGIFSGEWITFTTKQNSSSPEVTLNTVLANDSTIFLSGVFLPNIHPTTTMFEYSTNQNDLPDGQQGNGNIICQVVQNNIESSKFDLSTLSFSCTLKVPSITAGTKYYVRAIALNINGGAYSSVIPIITTQIADKSEKGVIKTTTNLSLDDSIKTFGESLRPYAEVLPTTDITSYSAIIHGIVNPKGSTTVAFFENSSGKLRERNLGNGTTNVFISDTIKGLKPNTTYHFHIVASNRYSEYKPSNDVIYDKGRIDSSFLFFTTKDVLRILTTVPTSTFNSVTFNGVFIPDSNCVTTLFFFSTNQKLLESGKLWNTEEIAKKIREGYVNDYLPTDQNDFVGWAGAKAQCPGSGYFTFKLDVPPSRRGKAIYFRTVLFNSSGRWDYGNITSITTATASESNIDIAIPPILDSIEQIPGITKSQIKVYNQNKAELKKQIELLDNKVLLLKMDPDYSKIDFTKIEDSKIYLDEIDKSISKVSLQEFKAINFLTDNMTRAIKILLKKRKFKKYKGLDNKLQYLYKDIEDLYQFLLSNKQAFNLSNETENDALLCYSGANGFYLHETKNEALSAEENKCNDGSDFLVMVRVFWKDSNGKRIEVQGFRVYCNYVDLFSTDKDKIPFPSTTSPTCFNIRGVMYFWLTDPLKGEKRVSEKVQLSIDKKNRNYIELTAPYK